MKKDLFFVSERNRQMKVFRILRNYFIYCGLEKDDYNALKKDAYVSNFVIWRVLHIFLAVIFGGLFVSSLFDSMLEINRIFYFAAFVYSVFTIPCFFVLNKKSIIPQFIIYLTMSMLFIFGCLISYNKPWGHATTFVTLLLVLPMFMVDKPFFMAIELCCASTLFLVWMHGVKPYDVWRTDFVNVIVYTIIGVFLNIIANSIRIREFVLTREIQIQKDLDDLTGLRNKGALTREINEFLADSMTDKGLLFMLDIDHFKAINDNYGHDAGDSVLEQFGHFLKQEFVNGEIVGRFGGDEFILFIKNSDSLAEVDRIANKIKSLAVERVTMPDSQKEISVSIGVAIYQGRDTNFSELFKKADTALYLSKADDKREYHIFK